MALAHIFKPHANEAICDGELYYVGDKPRRMSSPRHKTFATSDTSRLCPLCAENRDYMSRFRPKRVAT